MPKRGPKGPACKSCAGTGLRLVLVNGKPAWVTCVEHAKEQG